MRSCPRCSQPIGEEARSCEGCGWKDRRSGQADRFDPFRFVCSHEDRGQRCANVATMSQSTLGGGPWFCHEHFPPFRSIGAERYRAPAGVFRSLKSLLPKAPDPESLAERAAIQSEPSLTG